MARLLSNQSDSGNGGKQLVCEEISGLHGVVS